jgi:YVTN family beta-propeller protein
MEYAFVLLAVCCSLTVVHAQWLEATIPLDSGSAPCALCYNPRDNKVYCANRYNGSVAVIDGATNSIVKVMAVGGEPSSLCYNHRENKVYCGNYYPGTNVTVIDGAGDSVIASVTTGSWPRALCYNAVGDKVYCANGDDTTVTVIDGVTDLVLADVAVAGSEPWAICYDPLGDKVYCATSWQSRVTVIDGVSDTVIKDIAAGFIINDLCYNRRDNKVYCAGTAYHGPDSVVVIDCASDLVTAAIPMVTGGMPWILCYNSRDDRVYCALNLSDVAVIDGVTDTVITTLPTGLLPSALCYDSLNNKVYCSIGGDISAYDSTVTVIDGATNDVLRTIAVGRGPCAFTWNPAENRVYVANWDASSISVLRDSMSGVVDSPRPRAPSRKLEPTVLSGFAVQSLESKVVFDAMGRKATCARAGVYFVRDEGQGAGGVGRVRKVVVQR